MFLEISNSNQERQYNQTITIRHEKRCDLRDPGLQKYLKIVEGFTKNNEIIFISLSKLTYGCHNLYVMGECLRICGFYQIE